ncbi:hypothetical protein Pla175_45800 [Pirellulimonas nuda]|uniref:Uncharacterized protein n=1 Tax=Pirellulimonas nuda TaxID=2528009 RepID=A0A518DI48_9BACT|nr:hypothetical protein [Pirellulimonas nuda]QDU91160.1 hypothetical protein Pla175_45800 [Pirellulimonas nuda]
MLASAALVAGPATLPAQAASDLPALARAAGEAFRPVTAAEVREARDAALQGVDRVNAMLGAGAFGEGWRRHLGLPEVRAELAADRSKLAVLNAAYDRLTDGSPGLEQPALRALAIALRRYVDLALLENSFDAQSQREYIQKEMARLAKELAKKPADLSYQSSFEIERRIDFIAGLGRSEALVDAFRREFGAANVYVEAASPLLNRLAQRPIREPTVIRDCILGTSISGTGCTDAQITLRTAPSLGTARVQFTLAGIVNASTTGLNGPVAIRSSSQTQFQSQKLVEFGYDSFLVFPADADATTRSQTRSVTKVGGGLGTRLVEKIARRRVAEQKSTAERQSAVMAEERIAERFDEDLLLRIRDARKQVDDAVIRPAERRHATPRRVELATSGTHLSARLVVADRGQFAAAGPPPSAASSGDLTARLHETAVQHLAGVMLAGATIEKASHDAPVEIDRRLPKAIEDALTKAPARTLDAQGFRPWKMTLRKVRPLSVRMQDNVLAATLHLSLLDVGSRVFRGWDLTFRFTPDTVDGRWVLVRQGKVDPLPVGFDPESGLALRGQPLTERGAMIEEIEESLGDSLDVVEIDSINFSQPAGLVRGLRTASVLLGDGWATASWQAF